MRIGDMRTSESPDGLLSKLNNYVYINTISLESNDSRITHGGAGEIHEQKYFFIFQPNDGGNPIQLSTLEFDALCEVAAQGLCLSSLRRLDKAFKGYEKTIGYLWMKSIDEKLLGNKMVELSKEEPVDVFLSDFAKQGTYIAGVENYS